MVKNHLTLDYGQGSEGSNIIVGHLMIMIYIILKTHDGTMIYYKQKHYPLNE
jgi:hypothetical protein